ncbi:hypothetical protein ACWEQG_04105 [Microbispora sp. NPDC004025]
MRGGRFSVIIGSALLGTVALWPASSASASTGAAEVAVAQAASGSSYAKPKPPKCTYRCTNHRKYKCCPKCTRVKGKC